jgi:hypothetical protein
MDESSGPGFDANLTSSILEHELRLVSEAIDAVASGHFPSVTVAGLRFGTELLPRAQAVAAGRGLRVRPLFHADEHGTDLVVEGAAVAEPGR